MGALLASFALFAVIALLVLDAAGKERDVPTLITMGVFFAYLLHADTVLTSAYLTEGRLPVPHVPFLVLGGVVMAVGAGLFLWSTRVLVGHGAFSGVSTTRLVTSGPYAWMRHPQDVGWGMVLLGIALAGHSWIGLLLVLVFVAFVVRVWRVDDGQLERRFGDDYRRYRDDTPPVGLPAPS